MSLMALMQFINRSRGTTRLVVVAAAAATVGVLLAMEAPAIVDMGPAERTKSATSSIEHRLKNLEDGQKRLEQNDDYFRSILDQIRAHLMEK